MDVMQERDCPFCRKTHRSPHADVLEAEVMACRDAASPGLREGVEAWRDRETEPDTAEEIARWCRA